MPLLFEINLWYGVLMSDDRDLQNLSREELMALAGQLRESSAEIRKESECLRSRLDEQNEQVRWIRHRVKNIFQIIISLLNLQERTDSVTVCAPLFAKSRFRIQMMSVMYDHIYKAPFAQKLGFGNYIQEIIGAVCCENRSEFGRVTLAYDMGDLTITAEQAIPLGLIAFELAMNAVAHAFPLSYEGVPTLSFVAKKSDGVVSFSVSDNGVGIKDGAFEESKKLGFFLVRILCTQIRGMFARESDRGTTFTVAFPE
jgi:two-component sensor histidine kinase